MRRVAIAAILLSALAAPAMAQGIDLSQGGPIDVTAQSGIEWLQNQHEVIATGDARAVRQNVTITADRLIAFYRPKAANGANNGAMPAAATTTATPGLTDDQDSGGNEVYRLQAEGNVKIFTQTDTAQADRAVYDVDQAVLVLTGHDLKLTTPNDVLTAKDDVEYWSQKHMAVARGDAVVVTKDARRIQADTLVAYTKPAPQPAPGQPQAKPVSTGNPSQTEDTLGASGQLEKVEAFGHVLLRTPTDLVTGDRGIYIPETGMAVLVGDVRINRGQNQLAGAEAQVNMKTGVARLVSGQTNRVEGLIVPNDTTSQNLTGPAAAPAARR